ncbi:MAG: DUF4126 domain-containing protein, partial [Pseudomonadota bacterium]
LGAAAALVSSRVGLRLRKPHQPRPVANAALGMVEDGLAFGLGRAALRQGLQRPGR